MARLNVDNMVKSELRRLGAAGLCNDECGCGLEDFAPCGDGPKPECMAAKVEVLDEPCGECGPGDLWYSPLDF